jgi:hypothetical protein
VIAQQDGSEIKHFFRQSEMNTLLNDCRSGLNEVLEVFQVHWIGHNTTTDGIQNDIATVTFNSVVEMKQKTENMHNELLELIATLSDGTISDRCSSVCTPYVPQPLRYNSRIRYTKHPITPKIGENFSLLLGTCVCAFWLKLDFILDVALEAQDISWPRVRTQEHN